MKSSKGFFTGLAIFIAFISVGFSIKSGFAKQAAQIQSASAAVEQSAQNEGLVRLSAPAKAAPGASSASSASAAFASAALRNSELKSSLTWVFGGKSQRGWQIYAPLISSLIGADADATTSDFAAQLSRWQKERGLEPNGILNNYVWSGMISAWQSERIKDRTYPTADQLATIPPSDCYDPQRPEELRKVERETYNAYKRMVAAARAELGLSESDQFFKIISAFRSREYQDHLRKQSPNSGRAGLAVNSPHFTGRALDIYVGGEPVSTKDENRAIQTQTIAYKWLAKNAARFGFRPYFYEPWHWEYVGR